MVTRALYRGPAHVCVDLNEELEGVTGDFRGIPIREQFPQLCSSGLFEAMDAVYITGEATEMAFRSPLDGATGTMLILPVHGPDGALFGVGLSFATNERPRARVLSVPELVARVSTLAVVLLPAFG